MPRRYFHAVVGNDQIFEFLSKVMLSIDVPNPHIKLRSNELKLEFNSIIRFLAGCLTFEM